MVREDIVGALTNALERGESEEEAKQSFLNASYPEDEIDEAVSYLKTHQKDEEVLIEPAKEKEDSKLEQGEIKEVKDIKELKKQEIKEMPKPLIQQNNQRKKKILKYSMIGAGILISTVGVTLLILYIIGIITTP